MDKKMLDFLTRLSHGLAAQFGENCEIVIHDINHGGDMPSTIVSIDNGHVTGRKIGDGPSQAVLDAVMDEECLEDITYLVMAENALHSFTGNVESKKDVAKSTSNVEMLLDDLIEQSVKLIGKPVALMTKDDKIRAINFLNESGAFLITKSGDKVAAYFNISKFTLYNYIDMGKKKTGGI